MRDNCRGGKDRSDKKQQKIYRRPELIKYRRPKEIEASTLSVSPGLDIAPGSLDVSNIV